MLAEPIEEQRPGVVDVLRCAVIGEASLGVELRQVIGA